MKEKEEGKITKRVRIYISFEPAKIIEGTVTIPSAKTRLSDLLNDEKTFLALQNVSTPGNWLAFASNFVLLHKNEIKAMVELD